MLSVRGVTPTTADQIRFDVFVTILQDAPAWGEKKKLEKAERASQKEASADAHALGLGRSSLERRKHTLASYLMRPNAVGRQPSTGTWRPTSGPAPQRRCKAPGGTCYAPVPKKCSKGMCTPHCLSFQIAYAQRFATCLPCKYKRSGVRHRHTPRATDATELATWIEDWQGHLDEPRWRHVAQNEEDENQDSDTSSVIDENPLAQLGGLTQPQPLTQPQTFSARAPRTQDLPPDHAEEETVEAYLERLLGSAPRRNSLPRRPGDTPSEDAGSLLPGVRQQITVVPIHGVPKIIPKQPAMSMRPNARRYPLRRLLVGQHLANAREVSASAAEDAKQQSSE